MPKRDLFIIRDVIGNRWFAGYASTLFTQTLFDPRRDHALRYVDRQMAEVLAKELREKHGISSATVETL